ncbi:BatA domain-containing protein [bacterium]|nr:BatA domain-containing protein [bacterium]
MFTFLNTIILSALALSLIPILIHLLNRKKSILVRFSTLAFLKSLQKKKMKKVKIRQILLLILRTSILLLAVMAFARPVSKMEQHGKIDGHARTSVAIVIDNGIGASYISESGMILDAIKNKTEEILNYLKEGDEAVIIDGAGSMNTGSNGFTQNFTQLSALVKNMSFSHAKSNITESLFLANRKFESAKNVNREIYILTTFQASNFADEKVILQNDIKPVFIGFSVKEFRNIGIRSVQVMSKIIEINKPVEIRVTIKNYGHNNVQDVLLNAFLDGRRVGQASVTLSADDESVVDMKIIPLKTGYIQGSVEIDDDPLSADNKKYFHVYVPRRINVLLAGNTLSDIEFIKLALNPAGQPNALIQVKTVNAAQMTMEDLSAFDVVVLSNIPRLDDSFMRRIKGLMNSGKGIMIIPGSDAEISNYNVLLSTAGFGQILNLSDNSIRTDAYMKFGKIDYSHPIIRGMYDQSLTTEKSLESPNFQKYFNLAGTASSQTIIAYSNNAPFLEESGSKKFGALLFLSAADLSWNDWPLKGIFVPLINRSIHYLYSRNYGIKESYNSGDPIELRLNAASGGNISLTDPTGVELRPKIKQIGGGIVISGQTAEMPGTYKVLDRGELEVMFDVNVADDPFGYRKLDHAKLQEIISSQHYEIVQASDDISSVILQSRYGTELWKWFVLGVLLLLITETLISQSHRISKR